MEQNFGGGGVSRASYYNNEILNLIKQNNNCLFWEAFVISFQFCINI